jgi:hypothetical protein
MTETRFRTAPGELRQRTPGSHPPPPPRRSERTRLRRVAGAVILAAMGLSAAYSANAWDLRDRFRPPVTRLDDRTPAPAVAVPDAVVAVPAHDIRSQPWWQPLTTLAGEGAGTSEQFTIDRHALQWRVNWRCEVGSLRVVPVDQSGQALPRPLAEAACPAEGTGYSVKTGSFSLQVAATGPWQMTVEQQVDSPLVEPPPPGMDSPDAQVLASGAMYDVDRVGQGTVRIVSLPDGRRVLRLEDFFVSINSDLEIWLSEHPHPTSTPEAASAGHKQVSFLKATAGAMNYELPAEVDLERYQSIVIWCELTSNAYAAAELQR